jgi:hypothetical protein
VTVVLACSIAGALALIAGLGIDGFLFVKSLQSQSSLDYLPIASLAQSLLLMGGSLASFCLVVKWLRWDLRRNQDLD